jgi:Phosphodiester glycosidase
MATKNRAKKRRAWIGVSVGVVVLVAGAIAKARFVGDLHFRYGEAVDAPHPQATWPWPDATKETLWPGVTHWHQISSRDATRLELFEFDLAANPKLRLEIYDQDEDDATPFDNKARIYERGVAQVVSHLEKKGRGTVLLACNGLYYGYDSSGPWGTAWHVSPVVLGGKSHYAGGENHRWTFGVRNTESGPVFTHLRRPDTATIEKTFDFSSGAAHCLVLEGKPYGLAPLPKKPGLQADGKPYTELGKNFEWMRTSRISLGWTKDSKRLYLLLVKEPDEEAISNWAVEYGIPLGGGWTFTDLQNFWLKLGVWGAINSDGGNVDQLTYRQPDGNYFLIPPMGVFAAPQTYSPSFSGAPHAGSLMYWVIREAPSSR